MGGDLDAKRGKSSKDYDTSRRKSRRSSSHRDSRSRDRYGKDHERRRSRKKKSRQRNKEDLKRRDKGKSVSASSSKSSSGGSETDSSEPEALIHLILQEYPYVASDLKQLLEMVDNGQGVDVREVSDKALVNLLKKLFSSLKLKQNEDGVFLASSKSLPVLQVIGSELPNEQQQSSALEPECTKKKDDADLSTHPTKANGNSESTITSRRKVIGPEMPSRELLDAAAKLTEAETLLREAVMDVDNDLVIGPPPPALVAEAASENEAERFEEVARIAEADTDKPYDVLGVNWKTTSDSIKKKYWKLSLIVHPDKCSHPQAHQAFVRLNQAFKDLQDPDKRKTMDEGIKLKEEQEQFKAELQALGEAAHWRRLQGISMEGDDELLAGPKEAPKRDEWMTTLPPERKPGVTMQSTSFSKTTKEGRGDTSMWTDAPLDRAEKAKQKYLAAYNNAMALADTDEKTKRAGSDADLVDRYNLSKRSVSLVQKHQEQSSRPKKKSKMSERKEKTRKPGKEEWEGQHPWKPWDRENDLTAGRKKVNLDSEGMVEGLTSRFSSGAVQRNFL